METVTIIIVNRDGKHHLEELMDSLQNIKYDLKKVKIIVVDNGSSDGSIEFLRQNYKNILVLKNKKNNYASALNHGLKLVKSEFVITMNNDIVVDENFLSELVKFAKQNSKVGVIGPRVYLEDGRLQSTGHVEMPYMYFRDRCFKEYDIGQLFEPEDVKSLCGCLLFWRTKCLKEIKGFDEDINVYYEDVDACLRASKKYKVCYLPSSLILHKFKGTNTSDFAEFYSERNRLLLIAKHNVDLLPELLFGNGYWLENNLARLFKIMPLVFDKIEKEHGKAKLNKLIPKMIVSLERISDYNTDHKVKVQDVLIRNLNSQLKHKEDEIKGLKSSIGYRFILKPLWNVWNWFRS